MGKYATFSGRATRSEFWWFYLFTILMSWGATITSRFIFPHVPGMGDLFIIAVNLVFLLPVMAAGCRRLHDTQRSGWWMLLVFTFIGVVLLVVWWAQPTRGEATRHGEATEGPKV